MHSYLVVPLTTRMDSGHIALTERDLLVCVHEKKEDLHYLEFAWEAEKNVSESGSLR